MGIGTYAQTETNTLWLEWSYINIDDCWTAERDPETLAIQANSRFDSMSGLVDYVNGKGMKVGIYSTVWIATYAGYIGGSGPTATGDYSEYYIQKKEQLNPEEQYLQVSRLTQSLLLSCSNDR